MYFHHARITDLIPSFLNGKEHQCYAYFYSQMVLSMLLSYISDYNIIIANMHTKQNPARCTSAV